jgi:cobalt/nickel transport system ATP-binding protein
MLCDCSALSAVMKTILDIQDLSYTYSGGSAALNGVTLQISENENVALLGPNGSGKTTLLLHLNGTLLGKGTIHIAGTEVTRHSLKEVRQHIGMLFQDPDGQLFMPTVLEDVMFGLLSQGYNHAEAKAQAEEALRQVGISSDYADRAPFHLSAGEKRRVALAGLLVTKPKLLVLDEPTTWLDPPGQRVLVSLLQKLPQPKLIATHDVAFAAALAQRAVFLDNGRIMADGSVNEVVERFNWRC